MGTLLHAQAGIRELLQANRTYYVRTDGSDSNNGLTDSSGGAFLTIQHAVDVASVLDLNGYTLTIQIGDGTYSEDVLLKNVGGFAANGDLIIQGNSSTPSNVLVSSTGNSFWILNISSVWTIKDLKMVSSGSFCIQADNGSVILDNIDCGASAHHIIATRGGIVTIEGNYTISGGASRHWSALYSGSIVCFSKTITLTGTPAFSVSFCYCYFGSMQVYSDTFSGSATGTRYSIQMNGIVYTGGGGASYFPGNAAGSTATGGQYA